MKAKQYGLAVVLGAITAAFGCDRTVDGLKKDTKENVAIVKEKAKDAHLDENAKKAADKAGEKAREAARAAGQGIQRAVSNWRSTDAPAAPPAPPANDARREADAASGKTRAMTNGARNDVKEALAGASVDTTHVYVAVDDATQTLTLRGTVPNDSQKAAAGRVAQDHARGYAVRNELAVMGY